MKQGTGSIINVSSDSGILAHQNSLAYCTSKSAVIHFSKAMATDFSQYGIRINAVCPGPILTERFKELNGMMQEVDPQWNEKVKAVIDRTCVKRWAAGAEIANA